MWYKPEEWERISHNFRLTKPSEKLQEIQIKPPSKEEQIKSALFNYYKRRLNNPDLDDDDKCIGNYQFNDEKELKDILNDYFKGEDWGHITNYLNDKPLTKHELKAVIRDLRSWAGDYDYKPDVSPSGEPDMGGETTGLYEEECIPCAQQKKRINEEEKAYHGSPNYFKCFRTEWVTNYAYGWGLYFAKNTNIPTSYANRGTDKKQILFGGKTPKELSYEYECDVFLALPKHFTTSEEMIDWAEDTIELLSDDDIEVYGERIEEYKRFIQAVQDLQIESEPMSYIYEVILHKGKSPDQYEYLNYDEKIDNKQFQKIQKALEDNNIKVNISPQMTGGSIYSKLTEYFSKDPIPGKSASLFLLNKAKIDGITHSHGEVRIIFDDKAIEIINVCKQK